METAVRNLKGFVFAFILFLVLTIVASLLIKLTPIPEAWSIYYLMIALSISCLFLGIYFGSHLKKKGLIYGALYSIIFLLIVLAVYLSAFSMELSGGIGLLKYVICILFGSIGGMIGVNLKI